MKIRKSNEVFTITQTATDSEETLFIRCKIFDANLTDVTPLGTWVNLTHIFEGMYGNTALTMPEGNYTVKFRYYTDANYTLQSHKYGSVEENYWVSDFEGAILNKIPNNILLNDDLRLNELNVIPTLATTSHLNSVEINVTNNLRNTVDDSDGSAV